MSLAAPFIVTLVAVILDAEQDVTVGAGSAALVGSVIAAGAGLSVLALGWTPVGWGLLAAAGAIVLAAQLGKIFARRERRLLRQAALAPTSASTFPSTSPPVSP